jgi:hypothetical protein
MSSDRHIFPSSVVFLEILKRSTWWSSEQVVGSHSRKTLSLTPWSHSQILVFPGTSSTVHGRVGQTSRDWLILTQIKQINYKSNCLFIYRVVFCGVVRFLWLEQSWLPFMRASVGTSECHSVTSGDLRRPWSRRSQVLGVLNKELSWDHRLQSHSKVLLRMKAWKYSS